MLAGGVVGLALVMFPLQHYMNLARLQHIAIGFGAMGVFSLIQLGYSWKRLGAFRRASLIWMCCMVAVVSYFFWMNPWLGNPDLATATQYQDAKIFAAGLVFFTVLVSISAFGFWMSKLFKTAQQKEDQKRL